MACERKPSNENAKTVWKSSNYQCKFLLVLFPLAHSRAHATTVEYSLPSILEISTYNGRIWILCVFSVNMYIYKLDIVSVSSSLSTTFIRADSNNRIENLSTRHYYLIYGAIVYNKRFHYNYWVIQTIFFQLNTYIPFPNDTHTQILA